MAQVTVYMDDDTVERMRAAAKQAGLSMSAWLAGLVRERTADTWPAEVSSLAGAWSDFPSLDEIRSVEGVDTPREGF